MLPRDNVKEPRLVIDAFFAGLKSSSPC